MALRRAVVGIGLGMTCGYGKGRVASYVHEAASAYYLMRLRLLASIRRATRGVTRPWRPLSRCQGGINPNPSSAFRKIDMRTTRVVLGIVLRSGFASLCGTKSDIIY
jgi:hypothetical protein